MMLFVAMVIFVQVLFNLQHIRENISDIYKGSFSIVNGKMDYKELLKRGCIHPTFEMWSTNYVRYADKLSEREKLAWDCSSKLQAVYIDINGKFIYPTQRIINSVVEKFSCHGKGVIRKNELKIVFSDKFKILHNHKSPYDFVVASCLSSTSRTYTFNLSGVSKQTHIDERPIPSHNDTQKTAMNVLIVGYDSTSQLSMLRNMPKGVSYMENTLGGVRLKDYNIVGDGTPQALFPILTGESEGTLPESRRSHGDRVKDMDDFPFIWKILREKGYVTQWGEDGHSYGTFTYRMVGFNKQPVDHYMRNYYMSLDELRNCQGNKNTAELQLDWAESFFNVYRDRPKFSFIFHSEYTHNSMGRLTVADNALSSLLKRLHVSGKLDNTLLILMADHGNRYTQFRQTIQGKIEERTPYMALRFPDWFRKRYPEAMSALSKNADKLTTPFDIHETLLDALDYNKDKEKRGIQLNSKRETLLRKINMTRDCLSADIEAHWCGCLEWRKENITNVEVLEAAQFIVSFINGLTESMDGKCQQLQLLRIKDTVSHRPKVGLLKFDQTNDADGRVGHLAKHISAGSNIRIYQITLITSPSEAVYESSVTYDYDTKKFSMTESHISRINKYGSQPDCIAKQHPQLRKYCFCINP